MLSYPLRADSAGPARDQLTTDSMADRPLFCACDSFQPLKTVELNTRWSPLQVSTMLRQAGLSITLGLLLSSVFASPHVPTSFVLVGDSTTANG